jgi:hypothetical protein
MLWLRPSGVAFDGSAKSLANPFTQTAEEALAASVSMDVMPSPIPADCHYGPPPLFLALKLVSCSARPSY